MAGFGMINPRMGALAKKKAMAAKTASKAAAAPGGAQDQTTKTIKKAGRQPPGPPMAAGPAKATSEKAPMKKGGNPFAKKGPVTGRNTGRGDSGGIM